MGGYLPSKTRVSVEETIKEAKQTLRNLQAKICRTCKTPKVLYQSRQCKECWLEDYNKNLERNKVRRLVGKDGYVRRYNDEGKLVYEHRMVMEAILGRELTSNEVIQWKDNDKTNNDPSNLILALKTGIPLSRLKCDCGCNGNIIVVDPIAV